MLARPRDTFGASVARVCVPEEFRAAAAAARVPVPEEADLILGSAPEAAGLVGAFLAAGIEVFLLANDCGHVCAGRLRGPDRTRADRA